MSTRPMSEWLTKTVPRRVLLRAAAAGASATALAGCVVPSTLTIINTDVLDSKEEKEMAGASEHYILTADEGEAIWFTGTLATIKASGALTGNVISLVEFLHPPGFSTPLHIHHTADEAFYVLEGAIQGITGDQPWSAEAGSFVWLPRGIPHGYAVIGDEPVQTMAIAIPSGFDQFVVEAGDPATTRSLPPPSEPNMEKLAAAAARNGLEIVGPLVLPPL